MIEGAVYVDGKVALRYDQPIPKYVKVGTKEYIFNCQHGIALIFVPEEEVPPSSCFPWWMLRWKTSCDYSLLSSSLLSLAGWAGWKITQIDENVVK